MFNRLQKQHIKPQIAVQNVLDHLKLLMSNRADSTIASGKSNKNLNRDINQLKSDYDLCATHKSSSSPFSNIETKSMR